MYSNILYSKLKYKKTKLNYSDVTQHHIVIW